MDKGERELRNFTQSSGGELKREVRTNGSGHLVFRLVAPNRQERDIIVAKSSSSLRAMENTKSEIRRFIRENPQTVMQAALEKVSAAPAPAAHTPPPARWTPQTPVQAPPAAPAPQPQPVKEEPVNNPTPPKKDTRRLEHGEIVTLTLWLQKNVKTGDKVTLIGLAAKASEELKFEVAPSTLPTVLTSLGVTLGAATPRGAMDRVHVVAKELAKVMESLGIEQSPEFVAVVKRQGAPQ